MKSKIKRLVLQFVLLLCFTACFAQTPGVRNGHNMVYDSAHHGIFLFGGADEGRVYGDSWLFARGRWNKLSGDGPSPRTFPCLVDVGRYILLFGGNAVLFGNERNPVHYLEDTWKFQDGHWEKLELRIHPGPRAEAAMGYDPLRGKVILFGGRQAGDHWVLADTWSFDGHQWEKEEGEGPTARSGAVMTYDAELRQLVLFGGNPVISKEKDYNGPMWSWDGQKWKRMDSNPPLVFNSTMAYNSGEHFMLRFGGWDGQKRSNETWIYKDQEWKKLALGNSPTARNHSIMIYDPENNEFILFGGHDGDNVFGDMWRFKKGKWELVFAEPARRRLENGH